MRSSRHCISGLLLTTLALLLCATLQARELVTQADCRPLIAAAGAEEKPLAHGNALLWKVQRDDDPPSYLFGTIHVSDVRITRLPDIVAQTLQDSTVYVMEALPDADEAFRFSQMMYFDDDRKLGDFIGRDLLERIRTILANYHLPREAVDYMKPWAAFLVMNYPAEEGVPLDLALYHTAEQNGAELKGLETLVEQGEIFATMPMDMQLQLLLDTVCNYETVNRDFEVMKSLYLERDLQALFDFSNRYTVASEAVYTDLLERVLFKRNERMVERLLPVLKQGVAFIAVGAMHLPGDEGILSLLEDHGYSIKPIY